MSSTSEKPGLPDKDVLAASRDRFEALYAQSQSREDEPSAEVLSQEYSHSPQENQLYGDLLRRANEGTLRFDPVENIKGFTRVVEALSGENQVADIQFSVDPTIKKIDDLPEDTVLRIVQQVRFAKSLGYRVPGKMRIEDGTVKMRVAGPREDTPDIPGLITGANVIDSTRSVLDKNDMPIEPQVAESLRAAQFKQNFEGFTNIPYSLDRDIERVTQQIANEGEIIPLFKTEQIGAVSYYKALAEALGYHVEAVELDDVAGGTKIKVARHRRPGFESSAQELAPTESIVSSEPVGEKSRWVAKKDGGWKRVRQTESELEVAVPEDGFPDEVIDWADDEYQMISFFRDPEGTAVMREADGMPPMDVAKFNVWLEGLSPLQKQYIANNKAEWDREKRRASGEHDKLVATVPELYSAQLPPHLAKRLNGVRYAIGFNQSFTSTLEEAQQSLQEHSGIDVQGYGSDIGRRFMVFDNTPTTESELGQNKESSISRAIEIGYYRNANIGRFVVAFPEVVQLEENKSKRVSDVVNLQDDEKPTLPSDFLSTHSDNNAPSVSSKYLAGYIDDKGDFWENESFALSDEPRFTKR